MRKSEAGFKRVVPKGRNKKLFTVIKKLVENA